MEPVVTQELSEGWSFKRSADDGPEAWMSVAKVPTSVHLDLMAHKKIPDPFIGFNELDNEWVGAESWTYRTAFSPPSRSKENSVSYLCFDGLDTFAAVLLNGKVILRSENMFVPHRVEVTSLLRTGSENILEIEFDSAIARARQIVQAHPEHKWICWNGDPARLAIRKAAYHWGWDWGPILMTAGPWRPVRLETFSSRIADLWVEYQIDVQSNTVSGSVYARIDGDIQPRVEISISILDKTVRIGFASVQGDGLVKLDFRLENAQLWYPHGYGGQPLYEFTARLDFAGGTIHSISKKIGLRKIELVQTPDLIGRSFYFRINGVELFCGGSNWIPADSFVTRITEARYREWIQNAVDGNQIMLRIWGGGIWEADAFYDICDELGVLVWQDFMFGCGVYPAWSWFRESVREESIANVRRIRHHCSVVLFAGNNEDYQVRESNKLTYDYEDKNPENWLKTDFPARYIYEKLLPEVVESESPSIPYHPGSPWGDGRITSDPTVGDMHQWNVWHGTQEKYQIFDTMGGRFNSEFGMEAFPHVETIKYFCNDKTQLYPQSHMIDFHNKADGHERRIAIYLAENFQLKTGLEDYIHLTQLSQSEALMFAYRGWRKRWGQQRFCGGALVWQLNDCWPVTSWSICDYFGRRKPAYYSMTRSLAPIAVGVQRAYHDWSASHSRPAKTTDFELWVVSSKLEELVVSVQLRFVSIRSGKDVREPLSKKNLKLVPNGTTNVLKGVIDNLEYEPHVLAARVFVGGRCVARDMDWPQPLKYLSFKDRGITVSHEGDQLRVHAEKPTKGLVFEERDGVTLSDNALDLAPGDVQVIKAKGLGACDTQLRWTYLGR